MFSPGRVAELYRVRRRAGYVSDADTIASPMDDRFLPRWLVATFAAIFVSAVLSVAAWAVELPYFAFSAGPVGDAIDAIEVSSDRLEVYPPKGELFYLTVSLQEVNVYEALAAGVDPTVDLVPVSLIRGPDESEEDFRRRGLEAMDTAKENAIAVALDRVGMEGAVESDGVRVVELLEGAPSAAVLQPDDIIRAVDGRQVVLADDLREALADNVPGDRVVLTVERDGDVFDVEVELFASDDHPDRALIGILVQTVNPRFPIEIETGNIGGPSAGMMYSLAIIDLLTPGDLTRGRVVAGTGTIDRSGKVGPIGGVRQKAVAAEAAGAEYMLVPADNFEEAQSAPTDDLILVPVSTIDDALAFFEGLADD